MEFWFPFKYVPRDSRIVIYGAGKVGQEYFWQVKETEYAQVVCFADMHPEKYKGLDIPVIAPYEISDWTFDFVVVAVKSLEYGEDIVCRLNNLGVNADKIIFKHLSLKKINIIRETETFIDEKKLAFNKEPTFIPIAVRLNGGLGDMVVYKRLIEEVAKWDEHIIIDVFVQMSQQEFVEELLSNISNLGRVIGNDVQLFSVKENYAVAFDFGIDLDLLSTNIKRLRDRPLLVELLRNIVFVKDQYGADFTGILSFVHYARCEKDGLWRYTAYNRYPGFSVDDYHTEVPLSVNYKEMWIQEFEKVSKYITLNYGWGRPQGRGLDRPQAKVWPLSYWRKLVILLHERLSNYVIVQTGAEWVPKINGCDKYVLGRPLGFVKWLLAESALHIDIEGGLVHLATQLGTKCIVLFGPTPMEFYGYPDNINIRAGKCHNCYWLSTSMAECYRRMDNPECMISIDPEKVAEKATKFLTSINEK
ncbi:glycosyltransferase family 9 protein [Selenomonas sp. KH1T6]|uniref:glycosyltransferase family 9 protein n=1 Tax=Selenomonas sp. KH1T6 TaxID=3158784 RepID=UPI0008A73891|nr:ADP-heptose:LPS heptosyltransferase [Selenomonas ruminantium]